ncbi:MAG: pirin family protein [Bacteroidetes bacterium]|nr:pirin family protein [Bacteroidota bacterium]
MKYILHPASSRGVANHGWLQSAHSFSFGSYYNPERMNFGALRVLNDDLVSPSMGFGTHGHRDMEIVSIPLSGSLKHRDSMGNEAIIRSGEVQVMSAGIGIEHSEMNASSTDPVSFLQLWIIPRERSVIPRYDQITLIPENSLNRWDQILSPNADDAGVWVHQDAYMFLSKLEADTELSYALKYPKTHGVYLFVLEGSIAIENTELNSRDAIGITKTNSFQVLAKKQASLLVIEVPMD